MNGQAGLQYVNIQSSSLAEWSIIVNLKNLTKLQRHGNTIKILLVIGDGITVPIRVP